MSIVLKNIVQEYPRSNQDATPVRVLNGVNLSIEKPSINMLMGPSGCGKSTLMRMMGGVRPSNVQTPTQGEVILFGEPCSHESEKAMTVFQQHVNRPDLTVEENIGLPFQFALWKHKISNGEQKDRVREMMDAVGLLDKAHLYPSQLSGGQNQRVNLARAMVTRPSIVLMDEPFSALDPIIRKDMQNWLVKMQEKFPAMIVFITHDVQEALSIGDRVIVLSTQPATIMKDWSIQEEKPRDKWVRFGAQAQQIEEEILHVLRMKKE